MSNKEIVISKDKISKDKISKDKILNNIFNVDNNDINRYIDNLNADLNILTNIDKDIFIDLIELLNETLSENGILYKSSFIQKYIIVSNKIFNNFSAYDFQLQILDPRKYSETNNEIVLYTSFYCYVYVLKIISEKKNGQNSIMSELNNSKFFNDIIVNNICPHFATYINDFPVIDYIGNFKMKTKVNHCIVYHYINSWKLKINDIQYRIPDVSELMYMLKIMKNNTDQTIIDNILYNTLFQVFFSILTMSTYKMNHNDLRPCNILLHGNYDYIDKYDLYLIKNGNEILKYYLPNMGFKIKIIDYGLTHSEFSINLYNPSAIDYNISNEAGIYPYYSDVSDQHYFVNDIISRKMSTISPNVCSFLKSIINIKYIGTQNTNMYICKYWRLAFPFTINYFISKIKEDFTFDMHSDNIMSNKYNVNIFPPYVQNAIKHICFSKLNYNFENKLEYDTILVEQIINFIRFMSYNSELTPSIFNMLVDPLDNNPNLILKPLEIIKKFSMYNNEVSEDKILNTYELIIQ
jgi:hypothetical protein